MKRTLTTVLLFTSYFAFTQVNFQKLQIPPTANNSNYRLVVDYFSDHQILFPVSNVDTAYVRSTAGGTFTPLDTGLFITAFYANNGDLYLVKNITPYAYTPELYKVSGSGTPTPISGASGRLFHRDQYGTLFYSTSNGFAYSTNDGQSFNTVVTPDTVYSAARNSAGELFLLADSMELFHSTDNGATWQDISKPHNGSYFLETRIWIEKDTIFLQTASEYFYTTVSATSYTRITPAPSATIVTNAHISVDQAFFCMSPYGFFNTNNPTAGNWNLLAPIQASPQRSIYNNFIGVTDNQMFFFTDTGYVYAGRTPNPISQPEYLSGEKLSLYPNPASTAIEMISQRLNEDFELYNLNGQMILKELIKAPIQTIHLTSVKPGLYFWRKGINSGELLIH